LLVTEASGKTDELRPDKIIIASGSIPALPPIPGINHPDCIDSTGALSLAQVPESLVIIGGGVIGVEMASVYNQFGSKVTIVEMQPGILPLMDGELGEMLRKKLMRDGIEILTGTQVVSIDDNDNKVTVNINKDGNNSAIIGEKVLVAIGRKAELSTLGLDNTSIKTDKKGILVNPKMQTNAQIFTPSAIVWGKQCWPMWPRSRGKLPPKTPWAMRLSMTKKPTPPVFTPTPNSPVWV
jgi:dihydrolipoamide dehydrogenase